MKSTFVEFTAKTASWKPAHARFAQPFALNHPLGFQAPAPSMIWGILAAASGAWNTPKIAYSFKAESSFQDIQKIWRVSYSNPKAYPIRGGKSANNSLEAVPIAFNANLRLWIEDSEENYFEALKAPVWPLSLGRKEDLAYVSVLEKRMVQPTNVEKELVFKNMVVPVKKPVNNLFNFVLNASGVPSPLGLHKTSRKYQPANFAIADGKINLSFLNPQAEYFKDQTSNENIIWIEPGKYD